MAVSKNSRELPYNAQAEQAVLGSALLSRECLYTVFSRLNEEDFFLGKHQLIYRAIKNLFDKQTPVDVLTVTEELMNMKELETIGGVEYLQQCSDAMVALSSIDYYVNIVNDQAVLRRLIQTCRDIDAAYLSEEISDVNEFIANSETTLKDAVEKRRVAEFKKAKDVAEEVKLNIETPQEVKTDGVSGLTTGFDRLNNITQGFHPGDMIIVAARPSVGKTALALNFAYRAANRTNKPIAIFSLEMPAEALIKRLIGVESSVSLTKITTGNLVGVDRAKVANAIYKIGSLPIYIDDSPNGKLMDIIAKSRKLQANEPDLGMIIIDYLGLVTTGSSSKGADSRQEEVRKTSLALKALARELQVPIIVVSQLSRDVEKRGENKRPILSDLRDSGSIEQDADVVMLLYREDYYKNSKAPNSNAGNKKMSNLSGSERFEMVKEQKEKITGEPMGGDVSYVEVNVAKNRNGQTGNAYLFFYKSFGRFDEPSEEWLKQMREIAENAAN
ncbi:MAG: replicative DNA helicase [Bacilli bacterium]|nr:replicative DNA helicase [Bacilli bacterium]